MIFLSHSQSKMPRNKISEDDVTELAYYASKIKKFNTTQYVSQFILKNMGAYPEYMFMDVLEDLIDRAYDNARKDGENPRFFSMLLNSEALDTPISIPLRNRQQNNIDLIMNGNNFIRKYLANRAFNKWFFI